MEGQKPNLLSLIIMWLLKLIIINKNVIEHSQNESFRTITYEAIHDDAKYPASTNACILKSILLSGHSIETLDKDSQKYSYR